MAKSKATKSQHWPEEWSEQEWAAWGKQFGKKMGCCMDGEKQKQPWHFHRANSGGGAIYGLGFLGALVYYLTTAMSFWAGLLGILKAIFWPGFLVYAVLKFLGA